MEDETPQSQPPAEDNERLETVADAILGDTKWLRENLPTIVDSANQSNQELKTQLSNLEKSLDLRLSNLETKKSSTPEQTEVIPEVPVVIPSANQKDEGENQDQQTSRAKRKRRRI